MTVVISILTFRLGLKGQRERAHQTARNFVMSFSREAENIVHDIFLKSL